MTSPVDLIAAIAPQFSPSEVLEEVLEHVAAWEPHIKALYLFDPDGARRRAGVDRPLAEGRAGRHARRRAGARSRTISPPKASRFRWAPPASSWSPPRGCAAGRACAKPARSSFPRPRCLITACCRRGFPVSIPSPATWDLDRIPAGPPPGLARRRGRLRTAASRDRHRRFGTAAGRLVRAGRAEAEASGAFRSIRPM